MSITDQGIINARRRRPRKQSQWIYRRDIDKTEFFDRDQELELIQKARGGDQAARASLILSMTPIALKIASRFFGQDGIGDGDLIQAANIAIIKAVDKTWKPKESKLMAYVKPVIRNAVIREIIDNGKTVRIPQHPRPSSGDRPDISRKLVKHGCRRIGWTPDRNLQVIDPTEKNAKQHDRSNRMAIAIKQLDEFDQEYIFQRFSEGRTRKDIAAEWGKSLYMMKVTEDQILERLMIRFHSTEK